MLTDLYNLSGLNKVAGDINF